MGKGRVQGGMKCNMAVADGNSTTPLCEMLFQLKPQRICLFLCLSLSPASFNLLITWERSKQSAPQNKLSAVFLRIKNELFRAICLWVFFCRKARWRLRHRDWHLRGDSITDGYTWSRQTFLFNKSGLFTDSSSHFSVVRQRWSCPAKWITSGVWV